MKQNETRRLARACVLGSPVGHSLSPKLHGFWLKQHNIAGEYTLRETPPEKLRGTLAALAAEGYAGCNLTLPLKEIALELMDTLDDSAQAAGAVNTVVFKNGKTAGYNSDGFGFLESLKAQHPAWRGGHAAIPDIAAHVVILGAGGAARGIIAALAAAGARHFTLINRTRGKAEKLIAGLALKNAAAAGWPARAKNLENATLLVNCTSLGMTGKEPLDLDLSLLPKKAAVCDIVYRPLVTPLLEQAKRRGHPVAEGLPMLLHQGRLGFEEWFGVSPEVTPDLYKEMAREFSCQ